MKAAWCCALVVVALLCGLEATAAFDMSGVSLPVMKSLLEEKNLIQQDNAVPTSADLNEFYKWKAAGSPQAGGAQGDDTLKTIMPLMMMMSMRRRAYGGMGYMGGLYGMGPAAGGPFSLGMTWPYAQAMNYPLAQAHMMYANPFLDPSRNPFMASFNPSAVLEPRGH